LYIPCSFKPPSPHRLWEVAKWGYKNKDYDVIVNMQKYTKDDWEKVSDFDMHNKNLLNASKWAGCYYCMNVYPVTDVHEFVDPEEDTALCPKCGVDTVVGDATGYPVTDKKFLRAMHYYGFQN
jgi:ferredoxin